MLGVWVFSIYAFLILYFNPCSIFFLCSLCFNECILFPQKKKKKNNCKNQIPCYRLHSASCTLCRPCRCSDFTSHLVSFNRNPLFEKKILLSQWRALPVIQEMDLPPSQEPLTSSDTTCKYQQQSPEEQSPQMRSCPFLRYGQHEARKLHCILKWLKCWGDGRDFSHKEEATQVSIVWKQFPNLQITELKSSILKDPI